MALLETCPNRALKEAFWMTLQIGQPFVNPRFALGERIATLSEDEKKTHVPITCTIFVDHKADAILIVFPGTNDVRQIHAFVTIRKEQWLFTRPTLQVQRGFLHIYRSINDAILQALRSVMDSYPTYRVVIVGYSLGGALSRLLAYDVVSSRAANQTFVMTWGAPRVFNAEAALEYNRVMRVGSDLRFEMMGDRIVHLPPEWLGFRHVGQRVPMPLPDIKEMSSIFEHVFAGVHQSYIPNMRFTQQMLFLLAQDAV